MFYRFTQSGARIAIDLDGLYVGETLFLLGGSPILKEMPLDLLRQEGIVTMAVNNVPCVFPSPNIWVCADKPPCFSQHIFASPEIMKFTSISRRELVVGDTGKRVRQFPSMFFFGLDDKYTERTLLNPGRDIVWWRSVFPIAIQLAWRLGFKRVFLVGCGFKMKNDSQYAWSTNLNDYQQNYSQRTYDKDLQRLIALRPTFKEKGFEVISSTPGSRANDVIEYMDMEEAIRLTRARLPAKTDTRDLAHSSSLTPKSA